MTERLVDNGRAVDILDALDSPLSCGMEDECQLVDDVRDLLADREADMDRIEAMESEVRRLTTWYKWPEDPPKHDGRYYCAMNMNKHGPPCYAEKLLYDGGHWRVLDGTIMDAYTTHYRPMPQLPEDEP